MCDRIAAPCGIRTSNMSPNTESSQQLLQPSAAAFLAPVPSQSHISQMPWVPKLALTDPPLPPSTPEIVFQDEGKERKPSEERNYGLTTKSGLRKKKKMELENFCTDGELYLKALHPLFMMGIFFARHY